MSNSNAGDGGQPQQGAAPSFTFGTKSQFSFGTNSANTVDNKKEGSDGSKTETATKPPLFGSGGGFSFAKPAEPKDGDSDNKKENQKPSLFDTPAKPEGSLFDTPKDETATKPSFGGFNLGTQDSKPAFSGFGVKKEGEGESKEEDKDKGKEDNKPGLSFGAKSDNSESQKPSLFSSTDKPATGGFPKLSSGGFGASSGFGTSGSGIGSSSGVAAGSFSFAAEKEKGKDKDDSKPALSFAGFGSTSGEKKDKEDNKDDKLEVKPDVKPDVKPFGFSFGAKKEDKPKEKEAGEAQVKKEDKPSGFSFGTKKDDKPSGFGFGAKKDDKPSGFGFGAKKEDDKTDNKPAPSFGAPASSTAPSFSLGTKKDDKPASGFSFGAPKTESKPAVSFSSQPKEKPKTGGFSFGKPDGEKPAGPSFGLGSKSNDKPSLGLGSGTAPSSLFGAKSSSEAPKSSSSFGTGFGTTSSPALAPKTGGLSLGGSSPFGASSTAPKTSGFGSSSGSSGLGSSVPRAGSAPPGFSSTPNAPQKSSLSTVSTASASTTPGQRTALRQNLLFTAINDTLYHNYITREDERKEVVSVGFAIFNILLNPSGTLLAVVGSKNVAVVRINNLDPAKSTVQDVSKHISASSIRSVLWNPVADPDATLEVLTGDNQVVSLGVSLENNIDMSVFELAEEDDRIDTIGEVVSFSFGHSSEVMGLLTLYLLNEDGDIFCLSPWMPSSALLTQPEIQGILDQAVYLEQTTKVSSGLPPPGVSTAKMFKGNLVWCYDLWRQIPLANKDVRHGHEVALRVSKPKAPFGNGKLKFQGPFVVSPYPQEMYTETAKQLITLKSRGIALFAELFESGRINVLMYAGGPVVCSWEPADHVWGEEDDDEDEGSNELGLREMVLLETIDLKTGDSVLSQCLHDGLVHSLASDTVTQIDTRNWYRKLAGAYIEQDMQVLGQLQNAKLRSSRVQIALAPDHGVSTFTERLILVSDQVYECDLSISEHGDLSLSVSELEKASAIPETDASQVAAADFKLAGLIGAVSPDIIHKINSITIQPDVPQDASFSMSEKLRLHPDMVKVFHEIASHFSRENVKLEEVSILMERRLKMQKSELLRQLRDLNAVRGRFEKLQKYYGDRDLLEALKQLIARQEDHEKRFDKLLTDLNRSQSLPLSDAERKWHVELGRLKSKLPEFEKQAKQAQTQAKQLAGFARNADTSFDSAEAIQGITRAELSRTSFMLEEEDRVAEQAKKKLELLLHKSQTRLAVLKAKEEK